MSYLGIFYHNIDANNRLVMPSGFREKMGQEFVLFKSPDGCVYVYDMETFDGILEQVGKHTNTPEGRMKARTFARAARTVTQDKQGRFTVPADYIEFASLQEGVVISGVGNKLEIWSQAEFDRQTSGTVLDSEAYPCDVYY